MKNLSKAGLYIVIIALGAALYLSIKLSALYFFVFLVGLVIFFIARSKKESPGNKRFLITLIILIFVSRFFLSLFVFSSRGANLSQDEGLYSKKSLIKSCQMKGMENIELQSFKEYFLDHDMRQLVYGNNGYTYILSRFYFLFGYQIQAARLINVFFNIIAFLFIFYLSRELFNSNVAKISSCIFAFFPSIGLWSVMIGVDMFVLLGIVACMFSLVKVIKKVELKWLLVMIFALLIVASVRKHIMYVLLIIISLAAFSGIFIRLTRKGRLAFLLMGLLVPVMLLRSPVMPFLEKKWEENTKLFLVAQYSFAASDDSGYHIYPLHCYKDGKCSVKDVAKAYTKGMYYVLLSPFPWRIDSKLQLMAYPQTVLWYFMIPFVLYGFYVGFRTKSAATALIFLYSFFVFSLFALVEGNIGALFRHKDMVMPFLIIYFAAGVNKLIGKHEYTSL